jgi:signal transduction histidine kinase
VSHELRTPLTALLGYAELLRDPKMVDVDRTEAVSTIVDQGQDLANIVDDLLTRAQAEAETLKLASVTLSFGAQVAQVVEGWGTATSAKFRVYADRGVKALGDPSRVRQIVRNLVSNAIRYGDGMVEIATRVTDESSHVLVANPGPPIPEEERERIFEPYHRVNPDAAQPAGLGLGLAISRQLARMMGGDITYHHHEGMSVFNLSLPRAIDTD